MRLLHVDNENERNTEEENNGNVVFKWNIEESTGK